MPIIRAALEGATQGAKAIASNPQARAILGRTFRLAEGAVDGAIVGTIAGLALGYLIIKRGENTNNFGRNIVIAAYTFCIAVALSAVAGVGLQLRK